MDRQFEAAYFFQPDNSDESADNRDSSLLLFGKRSWPGQAEPADKNPRLTWSEDCLLSDRAGLGASSIEAAGNKAADEHSDKSRDPA